MAIKHPPLIVPFLDDVVLKPAFAKDFPATVDYHYTTFSQIIIPPFLDQIQFLDGLPTILLFNTAMENPL